MSRGSELTRGAPLTDIRATNEGDVAQQVSLWVAQGTVTGLSAMAARGAVKRVVAKFREKYPSARVDVPDD